MRPPQTLLTRTLLLLASLLFCTAINDLANRSIHSGTGLSFLLRAAGITCAHYFNGAFLVPPTPEPERMLLFGVVPAALAAAKPMLGGLPVPGIRGGKGKGDETKGVGEVVARAMKEAAEEAGRVGRKVEVEVEIPGEEGRVVRVGLTLPAPGEEGVKEWDARKLEAQGTEEEVPKWAAQTQEELQKMLEEIQGELQKKTEL